MKLVDRYLIRTFLGPFLYCLAGFLMIFVIADLFDNLSDFLEARTPVRLIGFYYLVLIPSQLAQITPVSLLLGVLYSLSTLTKNNELTAFRASGISILRLMTPIIAAGLLMSIGMAILHETVAPQADYWCHTFRREQGQADPANVHVYRQLAVKNQSANRFWLMGAFDTRDFSMKQVEVLQQRPDTSDERKIWADDVRWLDGRWWFRDVKEQQYDNDGNPLGAPRFALQEEMMQLDEQPSFFLNEVKDPRFLSSRELAGYIAAHPYRDEADLARVRVDLHHRLATPWTCLVVTLLGIPFGTTTGGKGAMRGIALSIGLFFSYYVVSNVSLALGKSMSIPAALAGWLPVSLFLVLGGFLIYRMR